MALSCRSIRALVCCCVPKSLNNSVARSVETRSSFDFISAEVLVANSISFNEAKPIPPSIEDFGLPSLVPRTYSSKDKSFSYHGESAIKRS